MDRIRRELELLEAKSLYENAHEGGSKLYAERTKALKTLSEYLISKHARDQSDFHIILITGLKALLNATGALDTEFRIHAEESAIRIINTLIVYHPNEITSTVFSVLKDQVYSGVRKTNLKILSHICRYADPAKARKFASALHIVLEESIQDPDEGVLEELANNMDSIGAIFCFYMTEHNVKKLLDILLIRLINFALSEGKRIATTNCMKSLLRNQNIVGVSYIIDQLLNFTDEAEVTTTEHSSDKSNYMIAALHGYITFLDYSLDREETSGKSNPFHGIIKRITDSLFRCLETTKNKDIIGMCLGLFRRIISFMKDIPENIAPSSGLWTESKEVSSLIDYIHRILFSWEGTHMAATCPSLMCLSKLIQNYPEITFRRLDFCKESTNGVTSVEVCIPKLDAEEDPTIKGHYASVIASSVTACIIQNESYIPGSRTPLFCPLPSITKLFDLVDNNTGAIVRTVIPAVKECFAYILSSEYSSYAIAFLRKILQYQSDSYWLIKIEILSLLETVNFGFLTFAERNCVHKIADQKMSAHIPSSSASYSIGCQTLSFDCVMNMLKDSDEKVRTKAAQVLPGMMKNAYFAQAIPAGLFHGDLSYVTQSMTENKWDSLIAQRQFARSLPHVLPMIIELLISPTVESANGAIKALISITDTCKNRLEKDEVDKMNLCGYFDAYAGDFCAHVLDWASSITDVSFQTDIAKLLGNLSVCSRNSFLQYSSNSFGHICKLLHICNTVITSQPLKKQLFIENINLPGNKQLKSPEIGRTQSSQTLDSFDTIFEYHAIPFYNHIYQTLKSMRKSRLSNFERDPLSILCASIVQSLLYILRRVRKELWVNLLPEFHYFLNSLLAYYPETIIPFYNEFFHMVIVQSATPSYYISRPSVDIQSITLDQYTIEPSDAQDQSILTDADYMVSLESDNRRFPLAEYSSALMREQRSSSISLAHQEMHGNVAKKAWNKLKPFLPTTQMMKYPGLILSNEFGDTLYKSLDANKFIPVIDSCMKMYKNTLNSKVQSLILDFLGRIVACGVNFSRLDRDNTFIGFIFEQLTEIEVHMNNPKHFLSSFFEFLCILMYLTEHKREVLTITQLKYLITNVQDKEFVGHGGIQQYLAPFLVYVYDTSKTYVARIPEHSDQAGEMIYDLLSGSLKSHHVLNILMSSASKLRFTMFWKRYARDIREKVMSAISSSQADSLSVDSFPLKLFEISAYISILNRTAIESVDRWDVFRHIILVMQRSGDFGKVALADKDSSNFRIALLGVLTRMHLLLEHFCAVLNHMHTSLICPQSQENIIRSELKGIVIPKLFHLLQEAFDLSALGPFNQHIQNAACNILECLSCLLIKHRSLTADATCAKFGEFLYQFIESSLTNQKDGQVLQMINTIFASNNVRNKIVLCKFLIPIGRYIPDLATWAPLWERKSNNLNDFIVHNVCFLTLAGVYRRITETKHDPHAHSHFLTSLASLPHISHLMIENHTDSNVSNMISSHKRNIDFENLILHNLDGFLKSCVTWRPSFIGKLLSFLQQLRPSVGLLNLAASRLLNNRLAHHMSLNFMCNLLSNLAAGNSAIRKEDITLDSKKALSGLLIETSRLKMNEAVKELLATISNSLEIVPEIDEEPALQIVTSFDMSLDSRTEFMKMLSAKCSKSSKTIFTALPGIIKFLTLEETKKLIEGDDFDARVLAKCFRHIANSPWHYDLIMNGITKYIASLPTFEVHSMSDIFLVAPFLRDVLESIYGTIHMTHEKIKDESFIRHYLDFILKVLPVFKSSLSNETMTQTQFEMLLELCDIIAMFYTKTHPNYSQAAIDDIKDKFSTLLLVLLSIYESLRPPHHTQSTRNAVKFKISDILSRRIEKWACTRHGFLNLTVEKRIHSVFVKIGRIFDNEIYSIWLAEEQSNEEPIHTTPYEFGSPVRPISIQSDDEVALPENIEAVASPSWRNSTALSFDASSDGVPSIDPIVGEEGRGRSSSFRSNPGVSDDGAYSKVFATQFPTTLKFTQTNLFLVRDHAETLRELLASLAKIGWSRWSEFYEMWDFYASNIQQLVDEPEETFLSALVRSVTLLVRQAFLNEPGCPEFGFHHSPREMQAYTTSEKGKLLSKTRKSLDNVSSVFYSWDDFIPFDGNIERPKGFTGYEVNQLSITHMKTKSGIESLKEGASLSKIIDHLFTMFTHSKFLGRVGKLEDPQADDSCFEESGENYNRPSLRKEVIRALFLLSDYMSPSQVEKMVQLFDYMIVETKGTAINDPLARSWLLLGICKGIALMEQPPKIRMQVDQVVKELLDSTLIFNHLACFDALMFLFQAAKRQHLNPCIVTLMDKSRQILTRTVVSKGQSESSTDLKSVKYSFDARLGSRYYQKLFAVMYQIILDYPRISEEADYTRFVVAYSISVSTSQSSPVQILASVYAGLERLLTSYTLSQVHRHAIRLFTLNRHEIEKSKLKFTTHYSNFLQIVSEYDLFTQKLMSVYEGTRKGILQNNLFITSSYLSVMQTTQAIQEVDGYTSNIQMDITERVMESFGKIWENATSDGIYLSKWLAYSLCDLLALDQTAMLLFGEFLTQRGNPFMIGHVIFKVGSHMVAKKRHDLIVEWITSFIAAAPSGIRSDYLLWSLSVLFLCASTKPHVHSLFFQVSNAPSPDREVFLTAACDFYSHQNLSPEKRAEMKREFEERSTSIPEFGTLVTLMNEFDQESFIH